MEIINVTDEIIEINITEAVVNIVTQTGAYPLPNNVYSVFGRVGNVVGQVGDYNTDLVGEGLINKYYTDARSRAAISENITGLEYSSASGIFSLASGYLIPTQAMLDAKVPYTGATGNVTLGEYQLSAGQVAFDQTPTGTAGVGVMRWNNTDGTVDIGLKGGNVTLQVGQEIVARVVNKTGADLLESGYKAVRVSAAQGQRLAVKLAQANNDLNSVDTIGIVTENIANNQEGFITILGQIRGINTTGSLQGETWTDGDVLYLSPTVAGKITNIKPSAPDHMVVLGYVEYAHQNNGKIYVKVQNGYELEELHNVLVTSVANNQGIFWDSATSLWKNKSVDTALGYTPVPTTRTITINGTTQDLSADRTYTLTTTNVAEGTNQYFTNTRARAAISETVTGLDYNNTTGVFSTTAGYGIPTTASQANWNTAYTNRITSASAPLSIASNAISISQANTTTNGFLSSTDWNIFNNKQAAGNYITSLTGEATATGPGAASVTLVNASVTAKVLTGVNITGGTVLATDSILTAFGKLQNQINGLVGGSIYKGTWNASTNNPSLSSGVGTKGYYYIVSVAGTTNLDGITDWFVGDWAIFDGTAWQQVDNTDAVVSVNGQTGAVSLTTDNISQGSTNLYFTNAYARAALSFAAGSGAYNSTTGVITIPTNTSQLTNGAKFITLSSLSGTAPIGYNNTTGVISITQAGASTNGYLSSTDWNTFNNKQSTLTFNAPLVNTAGTVSIPAATSSVNGYLSSTDWTTFNNKQNALTLTTTGSSGASTLVGGVLNVPNYTLAGLGGQPLNTNLTSLSGLSYVSGSFVKMTAAGTFTLDTNVYYLASNPNGYTTNTGTVTSIATTGPITGGTITTSGTIGITQATTTTSGYLSSTDWNTFNNKQPAGSYVPTSRTLSINGTSFDLSANRTWNVGTVTSVAALTIGTSGTDLSSSVANGTTTPVITLNVPTASATNRGALSSADWTTFNNKQNALTNPVTGTGTTNYLPKFTGTSTIGNSIVSESGGNVGIGTSSPTYKLVVSNSGAEGFEFIPGFGTNINVFQNYNRATSTWGTFDVRANDYVFRNQGTAALTIASTGAATFSSSVTAGDIFSTDGTRINFFGVGTGANVGYVGTTTNHALAFLTNNTERMRITSGGFTKASNDGTYYGSAGTYHEIRSNVGDWTTIMSNTNASPSGLFIQYVNASPNNGSNNFFYFRDSGLTVRAIMYSNGGLANFQANDVNLSDERTKKDIIPLESYWDKFKAIEIVKFKYKDQTHDDFNIGVIAQQVESVAPEFVDVDGWDNMPKLDENGNEIISDEEPLKSIYTADLYHATIKVLQEAMSRIEEQNQLIQELQSQINEIKLSL